MQSVNRTLFSPGALVVVMLTVLASPSLLNLVQAAPRDGGVGRTVLVQDPVSSFTSCDQCNIYEGALWCPANFACTVYNTSALKGGLQEAKSLCQASCPGTTACTDFLQCYYGAENCGECLYLGGHWCPTERTCYPASEPGNRTLGTAECTSQCDGGATACIRDDAQCPECERFDLPVKCSSLLVVIVVSAVTTTLFIAAIIGLCVKAQLDARATKEQETPASSN